MGKENLNISETRMIINYAGIVLESIFSTVRSFSNAHQRK